MKCREGKQSVTGTGEKYYIPIKVVLYKFVWRISCDIREAAKGTEGTRPHTRYCGIFEKIF